MNTELEISLVSKINETYDDSLKLADGARNQATLAVLKARECGQYLIEAKQVVGHGNWRSWLVAHVQQMHYATAFRYMKLAEAPLEALQDIHSIRQAYLAVGILDKGENAPAGKNNDPDGVNWISLLSKLTVNVEKIFDSRPIAEWQQSEKDIFVERAKPVVKRYVEAGGSLSSL